MMPKKLSWGTENLTNWRFWVSATDSNFGAELLLQGARRHALMSHALISSLAGHDPAAVSHILSGCSIVQRQVRGGVQLYDIAVRRSERPRSVGKLGICFDSVVVTRPR